MKTKIQNIKYFTKRMVLMLLLALLTTATAWADGISYLDATGTQQSCTTYTTVESSSTFWNSGWFVVNSNTTISDRITVSGTVNLILTNNATLTASKGITVGSDATLNIYAQTDDEATMGALVASGANDNQQYNAGIGGVDNTAAGTITINGGKINATGKVGAGIGSGGQSGATVGTITINGGIVTAQDGDGYGAGIGGGGILGKASTINLNGGIINAAGIGSGYLGGDCSITVNISDGIRKIVATPVQGGACIGKGKSASGSVTVNFISGGNIVTGDDKDAVFYDTDEGSERQIRTKALNHTVSMSDDLKAHITVSTELAITGETVTLTLGTAVDASTLKVNDGTSDLTLTDAGNRNFTFTMPAGNVTVTVSTATTYSVNLPANMEIVSATNTADGSGKYISGTVVTFKASFSYTASNVYDGANTLTADDSGNYSVTVGTADITVTATIEHSSNIDLSQSPSDFTVVDGNVLTGSTSHTVTIANGASIMLNDATITGGIVCAGTAEITLVGTNSVTGASYKAGIQVGGSGTTLTIKGNGSLTANGGDQSAGIGLSRAWNPANDVIGGDIIIEGGNITANGSVNDKWGAGIGTGVIKGGTAMLGTITIKGGSVKATGDSEANGIGTGYTYGGCTNTIGTVTIYDDIDKVDASSIKNFNNVVYMHGETNVTANKIDYFTIIEDGNCRVIAPKDNTDYTITIANGIEHGTLTGAATAKYMEKVTITATPALGYRFSRLVVKDAQNNDVASTGNSFFMPKSDVTVSAVFEQGTHGTTEFVWGYIGDYYNPFTLEATIYDGVTTVNLQQGKEYNIGKDYYEDEPGMGYCDNTFRLDEDPYAEGRDIPYSGGTGSFMEGGYGNFRLNGDAGFYDITMTDVGNGKWNVSILKTAGQMDVVPDQTYTGSEITPEPLVMAGSLNLTKGTDYEYSYTNNTNVGTAKVIATFQGDYVSLGSVEKEFKIVKSMTNNDISITIPSQTWTGNELTPVITVKDGENVLTENTDYTVTPPSGPIQDSGNHAYTITGMGNYAGSREATFTISPYLADQFGAVYVYQDQNGKTALLEGTSVEPVDIPSVINKTVNHVTSNRVFTPGKASTVMLPFNYTCNGEEGGTFYKFVGVKKENDKWVATMQETGNDANNEGTLIANTPYLFMPTATEMTFPNINGSVALSTEGGGNCVTADPGSHWTFKGTYWFKEWNSSNYYDAEEIGRAYGFAGVAKDGINVGDFVRVASDAKIRPMRAYLLWNDMPNAANARALTRGTAATEEELPQSITVRLVGANGQTTAIGTLDTKTGEMTFDSEAWYTLDGVRLSGKPTKKGLYINNGKKIVIR